MGHTEVAKSPAEAGDDVGDARKVEGAARKEVVIMRGKRCATLYHKVGGIHREKRDNRAEQERAEHEKPLEKVGPADGIEAAKEGVKHDDRRRHDHGDSRINAQHRVEKRAARGNARSGIHAVNDHEHNRRDDLKRLVLRQKAVGQKLRDGDGVVGSDGITAQTGRNKNPRQNRAKHQTHGNPDLAHAVEIDGTGQTHQHPRAHVGGARAQRGHQTAHVSSAKEVLFFAFTLF